MSCSEETAASFSSNPSERTHSGQRLSTDSSRLLFLVAFLPAQHPVEAGELVWLSAAPADTLCVSRFTHLDLNFDQQTIWKHQIQADDPSAKMAAKSNFTAERFVSALSCPPPQKRNKMLNLSKHKLWQALAACFSWTGEVVVVVVYSGRNTLKAAR